jgi:hypothetical protein
VGHGVWNIDEERLVLALLHEGDGLVRVTLGQRRHVGLWFNQFLVAVEIDHGVIAGGCAEEVIESLASGKQVHVETGLGVLGQIPLSETGRGISFSLQHFRYGDLLAVEHGMDVLDVASLRHSHGLATRHKGGPRRSANWLGVETGESHTLPCHTVDSWRANVLRSKATRVAVTHVVDEQYDEIGRSILGGHSCCEYQQDAKTDGPTREIHMIFLKESLQVDQRKRCLRAMFGCWE